MVSSEKCRNSKGNSVVENGSRRYVKSQSKYVKNCERNNWKTTSTNLTLSTPRQLESPPLVKEFEVHLSLRDLEIDRVLSPKLQEIQSITLNTGINC